MAPNAYQLVDNVPVEAVVTPPTVTYINFRYSETEKENTETNCVRVNELTDIEHLKLATLSFVKICIDSEVQ